MGKEDDMEWLMQNWHVIGELFLAILGLFSIIARFTPNKSDDAIVDKVLRFVHALGLTKKPA